MLTILERGRARLTGTVDLRDYRAMLLPDDPRIANRVFLNGDVPRSIVGKAVVARSRNIRAASGSRCQRDCLPCLVLPITDGNQRSSRVKR